MTATSNDPEVKRDIFISGRKFDCVAAWHGLEPAYIDDFAIRCGQLGPVVDVGCGRSPFLPDLARRQPQIQNLVALDTVKDNVDLVVDKTGAERCSGIVGSALDLVKILGKEKVGGIVGTFIFPYWTESVADAIGFSDQIVDVLAHGGGGLISPLFLQPGPSAIYHIRKHNMSDKEARAYIDDLRAREKAFVDRMFEHARDGRVSLQFREASEELEHIPIAQEPSKMEVDSDRYPHWYSEFGTGLAVEIQKL